MKKLSYIIPALAAITLCWWLSKTAAIAGVPQQASPETRTKTIVAAATDFLNTLTNGQRKTAQFEFLRPKVATATQFDFSGANGR